MPRKRLHVDDLFIYFITTRTFENKVIFNNHTHCKILLKNIDFYRNKHKFKLLAFCILLDHLHLLIFPTEKIGISKIMQLIKYRTARDIRKLNNEYRNREPGSRLPEGGERKFFTNNSNLEEPNQHYGSRQPSCRVSNKIWQKSFYDRITRSDQEFSETMNYININAFKHGLVDDPIKWPYSSYHNYYRTGKEIIEIDYFE